MPIERAPERAYTVGKRHRKGETQINTTDTADRPDIADLKDLIVSSLDDDKGQDIQVIDLNGQSALADYIVVASGTSSRHIVSMAEKLRDRLGKRGVGGIRVEGLGHANWVVLDAGDVIVHIFRPEVREFYNIEKMWSVPDVSLKTGGKNSGLNPRQA